MSQVKCFELHSALFQSPLSDPKRMARIVARALPFSGHLRLRSPAISATLRWFSPSSFHGHPASSSHYSALLPPTLSQSSFLRRSIHVSPGYSRQLPFAGYNMRSVRGIRKLRRRNGAVKKPPPPPKETEIELSVRIGLDDDLPNDHEVVVTCFAFLYEIVYKLLYRWVETSVGMYGSGCCFQYWYWFQNLW